jgi:thiol-disulfide isomerase/thioredoxin
MPIGKSVRAPAHTTCGGLSFYRIAKNAMMIHEIHLFFISYRCGPCRAMAPIFEAMAIQYADVVFIKIDVDKVPRLKNELGVWALPTFCFLKRGKKVGSVMGANERNVRRGLENDGNVGVCSSCCIQ